MPLLPLTRRAFLAGAAATLPQGGGVLPGVDVLRRDGWAQVAGKRIGLITNASGILRDGTSSIDALASAPGVHLEALFAPEHGIRSREAAGASIRGGRDEQTGLPVHSLYGRSRKPLPDTLRGLDMLVYDIQDVGCRSYTFISTLGLCMEAAADAGIGFLVLDRPDAQCGLRVEGNLPAPGFRSFVGRYRIPYVYGMTVGELARMLNQTGMLAGGARCRLDVVTLAGWHRGMLWADTGLPWAAPSPHIPRADSALYYAATGIAGEPPTLSIGVGTPIPFEVAGAPGLDGGAMANVLNAAGVPGVQFEPATWMPRDGVHAGAACGGVRIRIADPVHAELTRANFEVMAAVMRIAPGLDLVPPGSAREFDAVCGSDRLRRSLGSRGGILAAWRRWDAESRSFLALRRRWLVYA